MSTWEGHPKQDEYRAANGGFGMCTCGPVGDGRRGHCILNCIGCDVDHLRVKALTDADLRARVQALETRVAGSDE